MVAAANPAHSDDALNDEFPETETETETSVPEAVFVGRAIELDQALNALRIGHSLVVKGSPGIGKRALLHEVRRQLAGERICLWPTLTTPKIFVAELAEQVHQAVGLAIPERLIPPRFRSLANRTGTIAWRHIQRTVVRQPAQEVILLVLGSLAGRADVVLFVESLEIPPSQADMLHQLAEHCQVAAGIEDTNRRNKVMRLLWRFQLTLELKPLIGSESRALVAQHLERDAIEFESTKVREAFIAQVVRESRGIPAAIAGMLTAATNEREVTRRSLRDYHHDAAITYLDMTPMIMILVVCLMALRYISRGIGVQELMVLAGVGSSLFSLMLFFARRMSGGR
jgi:hypothetical protein